MVEKIKKPRHRRLTVYLPRVHISKLKLDPDTWHSSSYIEWLKENTLPGPRGRLLQIPSPIYLKEETRENPCIFHTEIDIDNENIENAYCSCQDSAIFGENKRQIQQEFMDQILGNTDFDNLPPLHNVKEDVGTQTINKVYKYTCKVCYSKFDNLEYFKHHQSFHSVKNYGCSYCNATFTNKKKLRTHFYYHLNRNFYECSNCRAAFEHKYDLKKHMRIHQERKWWICDVCPAKFDKSAHLENHKIKHESPSSGKLIHIFRKIKDANNGNNARTMGTTSISVPVDDGNAVVGEDENVANNYFTCQKCVNLTISSYAALLKHEKIHKRRDGDFVCDTCAGRFVNKSALSNHRKHAH